MTGYSHIFLTPILQEISLFKHSQYCIESSFRYTCTYTMYIGIFTVKYIQAKRSRKARMQGERLPSLLLPRPDFPQHTRTEQEWTSSCCTLLYTSANFAIRSTRDVKAPGGMLSTTTATRHKFPKLEEKNIQFWFKNRRAKCKRLNNCL